MREYNALARIRKSVPRSIYWRNAQTLVSRYGKDNLLSFHSMKWQELNSYVYSEFQIQNTCVSDECPEIAEQRAMQERMRVEREEFSNDGDDVLFMTPSKVNEERRDATTPSFIEDDEESEELPFPLDDVFYRVKVVPTSEW